MIKVLFTHILLLLTVMGWAQKELSFEDYIKIVIDYHPMARQADLAAMTGDAKLTKTRGYFDPKINIDYSNKFFEGSEYYTLADYGLKIPTWFGIEIKGGFETNDGVNLNPENYTTTDGLSYLGISIPIGRGLLIDNRRAALKQAKIYQEASELEKTLLLNDLLMNAIKQYWEWSFAYQNYKLYETASTRAKERKDMVTIGYVLGENPALDTLEATIQFQNREISALESKMEYVRQTFLLSNYLWYDDETPLQVSDSLFPEPLVFNFQNVNTTIDPDTLALTHPSVVKYEYYVDQMTIQKRLQAEMLKPTINLNYNMLQREVGYSDFVIDNNYKWGLEFSFPILLRKERGDLKIAKIELQDAEYNYSRKKLEVANKIKSAYTDLEYITLQTTLLEKNTSNYNNLFNAEQQKFILGESSLFYVNAREIKWLEANVKFLKSLSNYNKAFYYTSWSEGTLVNIF